MKQHAHYLTVIPGAPPKLCLHLRTHLPTVIIMLDSLKYKLHQNMFGFDHAMCRKVCLPFFDYGKHNVHNFLFLAFI